MRPARRLAPPIVLLLGLLAACASSSSETPPPPAGAEQADEARLVVDNGSSLDMDVFLVRSGQRIRIGLAPASQTTTFAINRGHMAGAGTVHFLAVPVRGGQAYEGEPVNVRQGGTVPFRIPAQ